MIILYTHEHALIACDWISGRDSGQQVSWASKNAERGRHFMSNGPHNEATAVPSEFREVPLPAITIPDRRLRGVVEEFTSDITESVACLGQIIQPPTVRRLGAESFDLVCGLQRIEAARRMGLTSILCRIVEITDVEAEMWEIDENLIRAGLSPALEAIYVEKRLRIHEQQFGKAKARGAIAANAAMGRDSDA